jgi:hypothetical protein
MDDIGSVIDYNFFNRSSLLLILFFWSFTSAPNSSFVNFLSARLTFLSALTAAFLALFSSLDSLRGLTIVSLGATERISDRINLGIYI